VEELVKLRQGDFPEYQILLAPFSFRVGDFLAEYVSCNLDEMGQMKPLVLPTDDQNDPYGEEEDAGEEESADKKEDAEEEASKKDEDEPKIEDADDNQIEEKKPSDDVKSAAGDSAAGGVAPVC